MSQGQFDVQYRTIHGYRRAYVKAGRGPALLLLHGLGSDHTTWLPVLPALTRRFTVIAPDLLGHGLSDKPRADYTLGGYANGMRDLLTVLGIERATVVGHSFGGGVAMQFAYQFPERTERMVLVAPGGLGPEVTPIIRAISLPGFLQLMAMGALPGVRHGVTAMLRALAASGLPHTRDLGELATVYTNLAEPKARSAIRHVVRAVVDWRGQIVTMTDRAYLTSAMPMCVIWGADDDVIPVRHATIAGEIAPGARVEVIADCGHVPHKDHPERFARLLADFVRTSPPAAHSRRRWRALLESGGRGAHTDVVPGGEVSAPAV